MPETTDGPKPDAPLAELVSAGDLEYFESEGGKFVRVEFRRSLLMSFASEADFKAALELGAARFKWRWDAEGGK